LSSYRKGRRFEYQVRDQLERLGYWVVRQSRSAFPDLIALKRGEILLVECRLRGRLTNMERKRLMELAERLGARPLLAYREGRRLILEELDGGSCSRS